MRLSVWREPTVDVDGRYVAFSAVRIGRWARGGQSRSIEEIPRGSTHPMKQQGRVA